MNTLYFGDNLDILKRLHAGHPEGFIDLIYLSKIGESNEY